MSEPPPSFKKASDREEEAEPAPRKSGASDPLFNPTGLRRRTTAMGLAPAPHLGGLSGSPGALARAEEEARKQRIAARLAAARAEGNGVTPPRSIPPQEELVESIPPPRTGPPYAGAPAAYTHASPPPHANPSPPPQTGSGRPAYASPPPPPHPSGKTAVMAEWTAVEPKPASTFGQTTLLMHQSELAPSAPANPGSPRQTTPPTAAAPGHQASRSPTSITAPPPAHYPDHETEGPSTQRMLPTARPGPPTPATAMTVRTWEPPAPPPPKPPHPKLVVLASPNSHQAAAFRTLRDNLLSKSLPRVIAVTSANMHDGKTTCAANLALALVEQPDTKVLLFDGNFFDPGLARLFPSDLPPTVATDASIAPFQISVVTSTLHLATVAKEHGSTWRYDQHRFEELLDRLCRVSYDYIVIDTPALHQTPSVATLASAADGVLIAARAGRSTGTDLRRAIEQIPSSKALGVTLLDTPVR